MKRAVERRLGHFDSQHGQCISLDMHDLLFGLDNQYGCKCGYRLFILDKAVSKLIKQRRPALTRVFKGARLSALC